MYQNPSCKLDAHGTFQASNSLNDVKQLMKIQQAVQFFLHAPCMFTKIHGLDGTNFPQLNLKNTDEHRAGSDRCVCIAFLFCPIHRLNMFLW